MPIALGLIGYVAAMRVQAKEKPRSDRLCKSLRSFTFRGGRHWTRTRDLCRVKALQRYRPLPRRENQYPHNRLLHNCL